MSIENPIACSLTAAEMPARLAEIASLGDEALESAEIDAGRAVLRFCPDERTRERLAAIVAAEAACCPFLAMTLEETPAHITLTIVAPDGAEPVAADLAAAFRG